MHRCMRRWPLLLLAASCLVAAPAAAQNYPSRVIKLVVPFAAGGQPDTIARLFAQHLSVTVGPTIIDNHPGANTTIGTALVAKADPDGYTLLYASASSLSLAPALGKVDYDPINGFAPIATFSTSPFMLIVGPTVPSKTAPEFVAYAKSRPGKLNFVAPTGGPPHLAGELFKRATGIDIVPVSYRMMNQGFTDVMSGQMDLVFDGPAPLIPLLQEGKLHALVSLGATRTSVLPDVPTMKEVGLPDVQLSTWNGLAAPAGTPQPIIDKLNAAINSALKSPEIIAALARFGSEPLAMSPRDFAAMIKTEAPKWTELARASGIKGE